MVVGDLVVEKKNLVTDATFVTDGTIPSRTPPSAQLMKLRMGPKVASVTRPPSPRPSSSGIMPPRGPPPARGRAAGHAPAARVQIMGTEDALRACTEMAQTRKVNESETETETLLLREERARPSRNSSFILLREERALISSFSVKNERM